MYLCTSLVGAYLNFDSIPDFMKYLVTVVQVVSGKSSRILYLARVVTFTESGSVKVLPINRNMQTRNRYGLFWGCLPDRFSC